MKREGDSYGLGINVQEKGTHQFGDDCPVFLDLGRPRNLATLVFTVLRAAILPPTYMLEGLGLAGLYYPFDSILAQREIREYIHSARTEQTSIADFEAPNIFDPDAFNPGTIIRHTPHISLHFEAAYNNPRLVTQYCPRHNVYSEYPSGWQSLDMPAPVIPQSYIGIVRRLPGQKYNILTCFVNNQVDLLSKPLRPRAIINPIDLGLETHLIAGGKLFNRYGMLLDCITSGGKMEVLAVGKASKQPSRVQEKPAREIRAFGYSPV